MNWLKELSLRIFAPFRKKKLDVEMSEEMRLHLELRTQANIDAGMSTEEARRAARRRFGGVDQIQETCRDQRGVPWIEHLSQDFRYALRTLARSPGFAAVAVLSLALGIGVNTAIFSLLNAVLLRSLPVRNPQELRVANWVARNPEVSNYTGDGMGRTATGLTYSGSFPYPAYRDFRDRGTGFAEVFAFFPLSNVTAIVRGQAGVAMGLMVSGNFFAGYGAQTLIGRPIAPEDDRPAAAPVAVITYRCWERYFSLDPGVIGQRVTLNQNAFTIIGVLARGFAGPLVGDPFDFYIPLSAQPQMAPTRPLGSGKHWWVQIMARLAPGANEAHAQASLDVLFRQVLSASDNKMEQPGIWLEDGRRGPLKTRQQIGQPLWALLAVVGLLLLIVCANLAGLLLARGAARQHEMAVRAAMGANRGRLIRQSLTESMVLSLAGGSLGLVFAAWSNAGLPALLARFQENIQFDTSLDANVLGFTFGVAIVATLLSGLLPALRASRVDPAAGLKDRSALGSPRLRLGKVLVSVQVGLSVLLVVVAGLLIETFANLSRVDPGFDPENLLVFRLNAGQAGYKGAQLENFFENVRRSLAAIPGVREVALSDLALVGGARSSSGISIPGRAAGHNEQLQASQLIVSDSIFATMGIGMLLGRDFGLVDTGTSPKVAVVNESFARSFLRNKSPVGQAFNVGPEDAYQIVGVCRDAKYNNLRNEILPTMYFPYSQYPVGSMFFEVRSVLPALALAPAIRKVVAAADPNIPVADLRTQKQLLDNSVLPERLFASLCSFLALLAVLLSYIGLFGLMAYNVARRTGEIGIRMALGAGPGDVARPIVREALLLAAAGLAAGVPVALALARIIRGALYGVQPYDPATIVGGAMILLLIAALAAWIPARRAARVDPMSALRCE
jgi:predicted permease